MSLHDQARREHNCAFCGYNLRGLHDPRCPECGIEFNWRKMFAATRNRHPFLFEHQSGIALRSLARTLRAGLSPGCFWRQLTPLHRVHGGRLAIYFFACMVLVALPILFLLAIPYSLMPGTPRFASSSTNGSASIAFLVLESLSRLEAPRLAFLWWCCAASWPLITLACVAIFQTTMRRAGALPRHVWRTVIYSGDVLALAGLLMLPLAVAVPLSEDFGGYMSIGFQLLAITAYLLLLQRLAVACRLYLRIHQAALVVAATQVIFLLCVCLLCVVTYRW